MSRRLTALHHSALGSQRPRFFANICEIILAMISRFSEEFYVFFFFLRHIIIRLHQPLMTLRSYQGLAVGGGCNLMGPTFCFPFRGLLFLLHFIVFGTKLKRCLSCARRLPGFFEALVKNMSVQRIQR